MGCSADCTGRLQGRVPTAGMLQISCGDGTHQVSECHPDSLPSCPLLSVSLAQVICVLRVQLVDFQQRDGRKGSKGQFNNWADNISLLKDVWGPQQWQQKKKQITFHAVPLYSASMQGVGLFDPIILPRQLLGLPFPQSLGGVMLLVSAQSLPPYNFVFAIPQLCRDVPRTL